MLVGSIFTKEVHMSDMTCDNCRQNKMVVTGQLANVKSTVMNMVKCFTCGYGSVRKANTKRI